MTNELHNVAVRLDAATTLLAQSAGVTGRSHADLLKACEVVLSEVNQDILELTPVALDAKFASSPVWKQIVRLTALRGRLDFLKRNLEIREQSLSAKCG